MSSSYLFSHDGLHDSLTHLYAPSFMYDLIERRMRGSQRYGQSVGLIRVRMNNAEEDTIEESEIITCADFLVHQVRPDDIVGRMGIYEFLIVLAQDSSHSHYDHTFEKIINRCAQQDQTQLEFATAQSRSHERVRDVLNRLDAQPVILS